MNYFYFIAFLTLSILILIKPLTKNIANKFIQLKNVKPLGYLTILLGISCIAVAVNQSEWYQTMWMFVTFIIGLLLIVRGLALIFFAKHIKSLLEKIFNHYFKWMVPISSVLIFLAFVIISRDYLGPEKNIEVCQSDEIIDVVCGFKNPEDIVVLPDNEWMLISEFGGIDPFGKDASSFLKLFNIKAKKIVDIKLTFGTNEWGQDDCKRNENESFNTHGIDLIKRNDGKYQLGVINHKPRETVEMFELVKKDKDWEIEWRGCIVADPEIYLNDIAFLKNGNFFTTYMFDRGLTWNRWLLDVLFKPNTGHVKYWDGRDFSILEGSSGSQPNGISLDEESGTLYIAYNTGDYVKSYDINKKEIKNAFFVQSPDNITIKDGSIWVTELNHQPGDSSTCIESIACSLPFTIIELDKDTLKMVSKYKIKGSAFGLPTVAVPHDNYVYIGSFHADRIAYLPIR